MNKKEANKIYHECSERDRAFLKSILDMLVTFYIATKTDEEKEKQKNE